MIKYDVANKNMKISIFSKQDMVLEKVNKVLEDDGYETQTFSELTNLRDFLLNGRIKILIYLIDDEKELDVIKNDEIKVITYYNNNINYESLKIELLYNIKLLEQEARVEFEKYKLKVLSDLVGSTSHKVQAKLFVLSASQDIIKSMSEDIDESDEKKEVIENLYNKNEDALDASSLLMETVLNATSISDKLVLRVSSIKDIIYLILDEYIKDTQMILNIDEKIKNNSYLCGPLNDVIFIICIIVKLLRENENIIVNILIYEDEYNWYFNIECKGKICDVYNFEKVRIFAKCIKDFELKFTKDEVNLIMKKRSDWL